MPSQESEFLYLTTVGWKSGKNHRIEIWFVQRDGKYYIVSEGKGASHWVQNLQRNPKVSFRAGKSEFEGTARVVNGETEVKLAREVSALMSAKYKWGDGLIGELAP